MPFLRGGVLALDLSGHTGVAYGLPSDGTPQTDVWHLPRIGGRGAKFNALKDRLGRFLDETEPARIVVESPLNFAAAVGHSDLTTMRQQLGLEAIVYAEADDSSIPVEEVSADLVRWTLLGQRRFAKGQVKPVVMAYCRRRGIRCIDDNAADAAMVWLWFVGQISGKAPVAGPLFQEGAA